MLASLVERLKRIRSMNLEAVLSYKTFAYLHTMDITVKTKHHKSQISIMDSSISPLGTFGKYEYRTVFISYNKSFWIT